MATLRLRGGLVAAVFCALTLFAPRMALAWDLVGTHSIVLHSRDGQALPLGSVVFTPAGDGRIAFAIEWTSDQFKDYFLSMREFKCVDGQREVLCHVPYPYPQPATVTATDLAWLEHALLFMLKRPSEFGAKLYNGVYFALELTERGLVGRLQAVDLNFISAPPEQPSVPPFRTALRDDIAPQSRWFNRLTIE